MQLTLGINDLIQALPTIAQIVKLAWPLAQPTGNLDRHQVNRTRAKWLFSRWCPREYFRHPTIEGTMSQIVFEFSTNTPQPFLDILHASMCSIAPVGSSAKGIIQK